MNRTLAQSLVLVNWKGVFYERYIIDPNVTALEGTNGAGKTTVMIAAYVVLLPDMSRLRFTNLGETGATGGDRGIWGRLGEPGRPSYAALDFGVSANQRLVAGVLLERKGEPSVEPTAFIITGLDSSARLQELFLLSQGDHELVPEMSELRENVARHGGRMQVFNTVRDYFAALFDYGVTPLRLGTEEERNKLNEMLRTSMTGGISRTLTSDLRSFLFKAQGGLADTLKRMKANLQACSRTRTNVQESQRLEQEIGGVFEAGHKMFASAYFATRERAAERLGLLADARIAYEQAQQKLDETNEEFKRVREDLAAKKENQTQLAFKTSEAQGSLKRLEQALEAAEEVAKRREQLNSAESGEQVAGLALEKRKKVLAKSREALRSCQDDYKRASVGLADLQRGVEELHRRAGAHLHVLSRKREAERLLGMDTILADSIGDLLMDSAERLGELSKVRRSARQRLADADAHRQDFAVARRDLELLADRTVDPEAAHEVALEQLRRFRRCEDLAAKRNEISDELEKVRHLAQEQSQARSQIEALEISLSGRGSASDEIRTHLAETEKEFERLLDEEREARSREAHCRYLAQSIRSRQSELRQNEPNWRDLASRAERLELELGNSIADRPKLLDARKLVYQRWSKARDKLSSLTDQRETLLSEARELVAAGGPFDSELLRVKDELGAELLATSYEDVSIDEAGPLEARLGPLVQALVVDDPVSAAAAIRDRPTSLGDVWFVDREHQAPNLVSLRAESGKGVRDLLVREQNATRVTRVPERPRLGRKARESRAEQLRSEAEELDKLVEIALVEERRLARLVKDGECLLEGINLWLAGDPAPELAELEQELVQCETDEEKLRVSAAGYQTASQQRKVRISALRELLGMAVLLDSPDYAELRDSLDKKLKDAVVAQGVVSRCSEAARVVEDKVDVLRRPPLAEQDAKALENQVVWLSEQCQSLDAATEALEAVSKNLEALGWEDASRELERSGSLVPALKKQLAGAELALENAERAKSDAEEAFGQSTSKWQDADGKRRAAIQHLLAAEEAFERLEISEPSRAGVEQAKRVLAQFEDQAKLLEEVLDDLKNAMGRYESEQAQAESNYRQAKVKVEAEERDSKPAIERWDRLQKLVAGHSLLPSVSSEGNPSGIRGHLNLVQEAHKQRAVLIERLRPVHGAQELLAAVDSNDGADQRFADGYLDLWLRVRDWLRRRLPAQVAEVDDPLEALARLRDQLSGLAERLARQEEDLRGASKDVAFGIEVQIRAARTQVKRLNDNLRGVSFGGIKGIRVMLNPNSRMEQVLRALRDGGVQELLFQKSMPLEQALDEIFKRHAGGQQGGQRLLDYREYIELEVEIRREVEADWEKANPTRLSTGEAIGVGAALMMVVLTEWERDANLLRGRRNYGSLRFLFLDEANRLSRNNLRVLFDLCQSLELQLMIAAPEVAQSRGNTTYRLVRCVGADGREQVVVSGRRTRVDA